jgi:hypothetical protein
MKDIWLLRVVTEIFNVFIDSGMDAGWPLCTRTGNPHAIWTGAPPKNVMIHVYIGVAVYKGCCPPSPYGLMRVSARGCDERVMWGIGVCLWASVCLCA